MIDLKDYEYLVRKIEARDRVIEQQQEALNLFHRWFKKNRKLLINIPVSRLPKK